MTSSQDTEQINTLQIINYSTASLSLVSSFWMSYYCIKANSYNTISLRLILCLALSDFMYAVSNLMPRFESSTLNTYCCIEAALRTVSFDMSLLWATCIAILCSKTFKLGKRFKQRTFFINCAIVNTILCLALALTPLYTPYYKYAKGPLYCWIVTPPGANYLTKVLGRIIIEGIPIMSGLIISIVSYISAIISLRRLPKDFVDSMDVSISKLLWYPAVLFISFVPAMLDDMRQTIFGESNSFVIQVLHIGATHSTGLTNAFVYGLQRKRYNNVKQERDSREALIYSESNSSIKRSLVQAELNEA